MTRMHLAIYMMRTVVFMTKVIYAKTIINAVTYSIKLQY